MGNYASFLNSFNKQLNDYIKKQKSVTSKKLPSLPGDFLEFNRIVYPPRHPETRKPTDMYDYQIDYFEAVRDHHKVILNKSRKIGATETGLRIILFNILTGKYNGQKVMIVAGNNQTMANKFIKRLLIMLSKPFIDLDGKKWTANDLLVNCNSHYMEFIDGTQVEAYPAGESVRGEENVICVFMSEVAFIELNDDTPVYNALKPNVINIPHADFILESTPNGKRGFFYRLVDEARRNENEYHLLELPYTVALNKLLPQSIIEDEKNNPTIDFEQEYNCRFSTSLNAAFKEEDVNACFIPKETNSWDDILA